MLVGLGIGFSIDQRGRLRTIVAPTSPSSGAPRPVHRPAVTQLGRPIRLTVADTGVAIQQRATLVKTVSPELRRNVNEVSQWNASNRAVRGVWPQYQLFRSLEVEQGRLMTAEDEDTAARVILLGYESNRQLYPGKPVIGQTLMVNGYPYTVIGVLKKKKQNGSYGSGPDNSQLFVPFSSMSRDMPLPEKPGIVQGMVSNIVFEPVSADRHVEALNQVRHILADQHHFDPDDLEAIQAWATLKSAQFVDRIFYYMTLFFGAVATLTLALGGIGVMNIMLVAVTERTREIGIRKALGATQRDIRRQFLAESAIITIVSGAGGLTLGIGICLAMSLLTLPDFIPHPAISVVAILSSLVTLGLITVLAGIYPALRAASLSPIECLRTE